MSERSLTLHRAIPAEQLGHLNAALYLAQLRAAEVREIEASLALGRIEAERAATDFLAVRSAIGGAIGVALGESHGWIPATGEIKEVSR